MRKVSTSEWVYLGLSLAASYMLIMMQRDPDFDLKLKALSVGIKTSRGVRRAATRVELWFAEAMDKALEEYRC